MSSLLDLVVHHFLIVGFFLLAVGIVVASFVGRPVPPKKAVNWPLTEATIHSVRQVGVPTGSHVVNVGDFSYKVSDGYYSGILLISRSFSSGNRSPEDLLDKQFQVRYNPRKPEKYSVPQAEVEGFLLDPYNGPS